jgi:P27 family predicted phage terminase small subunit
MPGPPPKPYLVKIAEGNPGHQKLNPGPEFTPGIPKPPSMLKGTGRKLWKRLAEQLHAQGLMTEEFGTELEGLCFNYSRAIEAEKVLHEKGMTFEILKEAGVDSQGNPKFVCTYVGQRPEVSIAQKSWQAVNTFAGKFGLSPADQGKIVVPNLKKPTLKERIRS